MTTRPAVRKLWRWQLARHHRGGIVKSWIGVKVEQVEVSPTSSSRAVTYHAYIEVRTRADQTVPRSVAHWSGQEGANRRVVRGVRATGGGVRGGIEARRAEQAATPTGPYV